MLVQIEWRDPDDDWPYFYLLMKCGGLLWLKGADFPDGSAKHSGEVFQVFVSEVVSLEIV